MLGLLLISGLGCDTTEPQVVDGPVGDCLDSLSAGVDFVSGTLPFSSTFTADVGCDDAELTWVMDDQELGQGAEITQLWLASGHKTVTLTAARPNGESAQAQVHVQVIAPGCPEALEPVPVGVLEHDELDEASGLGQGRLDPGVLWTHNDSGDIARFFAMDQQGQDLGTWVLTDAPSGDWEDMSVLEGPDGAWLMLGDVGDNDADRESIAVLVLPEPTVGQLPQVNETDAWWSFEIVFGDGVARNVDAMATDPVTGALLLFAQEDDLRIGVHHVDGPFEADGVYTARQVGDFGVGGVDTIAVGADFSPLGERMLLRTGERAWVLNRDQAEPLDALWTGALCPVPLGEEDQGEGIAFTADGAGYTTVSEGLGEPIWSVDLVPNPPPCAGLEARILWTPFVVQVGYPVDLSVDAQCVPAGIESVAWDLGDAGASTELAPSPVFLSQGAAPIGVSVVDADGATVTAELTLQVEAPTCPDPYGARSWGTVTSEEIVEASGLGVSHVNPGVLWTHNDSGDTPRLFAVADDGRLLGTWTLDGPSRDWEDMSLGWDDTLGTDAVYIGDVGDNAEKREEIHVLVFPEPVVDTGVTEPVEVTVTDFSTVTLTYPDGPLNSESVLLDPLTGDLVIVTKSYGGISQVFRKAPPHIDGTTTELEWVADVAFGEGDLPGGTATTAGSFSPYGDRLIIRTYSHAYMWHRDAGQSLAQVFEGVACDVNAPSERQGEAIDFSMDGRGYITLSEGEEQDLLYTQLR
jgi:hypothetical protein